MDHSTDRVKLIAAFISDIINLYEGKDSQHTLKKMAEGHDLSDPMGLVPMELYNNMCDWIENQIGKTNVRILGRKIGETAYSSMLSQNMITDHATPLEMMEALQTVAVMLIKDPKKRGWKILKAEPHEIVMRRTQTFNSTLQLGLLDTLIRKAKVFSPSVKLIKEVAAGDHYDDYQITWK